MKKIIQNEKHGEIVYEESFWTGKKELKINGVSLAKTDKNTFKMENGQNIVISGNFLYGTNVNIGGEIIELSPKMKWYEGVLSLIPFLLILVWGNVVALVQIVPVVGGLIGGAISGIFSVLNLLIIKNVKQVWLKILISIAMIGATFLVCYLIGLAIVSSVK